MKQKLSESWDFKDFLQVSIYFLNTIRQINEHVNEIIESIPTENRQRVIGEFSRRIQNSIVARGRLIET